MEIKKIDKNFADQPDLANGKVIDVPSKFVKLFGVFYDKEHGFLRLPLEKANKISENVAYLAKHTAGGRVSFATNSLRIKIIVKYDNLEKMYHMPLTGQAGFSLLEVKNNKEYHRFTYTLNFDSYNGYESTSRVLPGKGMRNYVMYFPLYNAVKSLKIVIDEDAEIKAFDPYKKTLPILYYGSSITQGGCASRPDNSYQAIVSKITRIDHINLGFSGNCKGEEEMAKYTASIPCSKFVMAYDNNAQDAEYLKKTHEKFFQIFREKQPNTPVIFISATNYTERPGEYEKRRKIIFNTYQNALKSGDKNVYFIDGKTLYPIKFRESCSVDGAHPNDLGFYFIAKKILKVAK